MEEKELNPIADVVYNITNEEEDIAFRAFQKKYVYKKVIVQTVIFAILCGVFVYQGIKNPDYTLAYILAGVCLALIFFIWYNPYKIRKSLLIALKELEDDKYEFKLYDEYFSIKTILPVEEVEASSDEEEPVEDIPPRIVRFDSEPVEVVDHPSQFVIIMKKQTIYTIPKRCMNDADSAQVSTFFKERLGEDYILTESNI